MKVFVVAYELYEKSIYQIKAKVFRTKQEASEFMRSLEFNYRADGFLTSEPIETELF